MEAPQVLEYLSRFSKSGKPVKNLDRFRNLMNRLGNPQDNLRFIHVAGTNGKGSTVRMIAETLKIAGYLTGEYVSPYIYRYNDRILIDGSAISDYHLGIFGSEVIAKVIDSEEAGYSQFEITTAIAFLYYAAMKCDVVVLETGLGGLLDCTNIIESPICSVITSISYDHTAILGNTLEQIAEHKAGIIKYGCPSVLQSGNPNQAVEKVKMKALLEGSHLVIPDESKLKIISSDITGNRFLYKGEEWHTVMPGRHQIKNALTAIEALEFAMPYFYISIDDMYKGIEKAAVPLRCQVVRKTDPMIIIDGAHNPDGMNAFRELISGIRRRPKVLVCGMLEDKDWEHCAEIIAPCFDKVYCVDGFFRNAVFAPKLALKFPNAEVSNLREAYYLAAAYAGKSGLAAVSGSLYLAPVLDKYSQK